MKKLTLILLSVLMIVTLAACGSKKCEQHVYDDCADTECNVCGETRDSMHSWKDADCDTPKTCTVCGKTEGSALGHKWTTPDVDLCEVQSTCSRCGATDGENKEHTPAEDDGDCSTEVKCTVCGDVTTPAGQHTPNDDDGNCLTAITCQNCSEVLTAARSEHEANADDGDCTTAVTCKHCTTVLTEAKSAHEANADDGNCLTAISCSVCGTTTTPAKESHTGGTATCTEKAVCTACGTAYGELNPDNHTFVDGVCACGIIDATEMTADELKAAVADQLAAGETDIIVTLKPDAPAEMITAIRRAICDTEGVDDGSINLTLKGVTSIPGTTNWDGVAFGPRNAQWDENNVEIVSHEEVTQLASVNLPDVTEIGAQAFLECSNLASITAPKVQSIGDWGLQGTAITSIDMPLLKEARYSAFCHTALTEVSLPSLETAGVIVFGHCKQLRTVDLPKLQNLSQQLFTRCTSLVAVNAPAATSMGINVFKGCSELVSITLPGVTELTYEAFAECTKLENITLSSVITSVNVNLFGIDSSLSSNITLTLNCGQEKAETLPAAAGTNVEWASFTWKEVKFAHSYVDGKCKFCNEPCSEHTGGKATCTTLAVCESCGASYGELADHSTTADGDRAATCKELAYCSVCDSEYGEKNPDNHVSENYTYTDNGDGTHDKVCTVCGDVVADNENHTIENHVCTACGAMEIVVSFDAGDFEWKTGDELYFCRISRYNQWEEYCFTATIADDGTVTWTPDKTLYWDGTGEHGLIVSYPCTAVGWDDFMIPTDQSDVDKLKKADCMNARWIGTPTTNVIEFELKHRMAKITVNYTIASQFDLDAPVIAEIYSNAMYCIFSDADGLPIITSVGQYDAWITPYHNDNQFTVYVAPGEYNTDGMFKFYIGDTEVQIKIVNPGAVTLEEGGEYTFDVKVGQDVIYIEEVSMGDIDSPFGVGWTNDTEEDLGAVSITDTQDEGKTAWENGDQIIVTFTSPSFGTQYGTLTYNDSDNTWSTDVSFSYLENETPTVSAIYAPCYEVVDGNMQLKDGMKLGMTEYISAACSITDETLNISFEGATRNYSRLRIIGLSNQTLTVITHDFTPAGANEVAIDAFTLTTDDNGNAFLYGVFAEGATVSVKQGDVVLKEYAFTAEKLPGGTEQGKSYVLDAMPVIDGTLGGKTTATEEDINALVDQLKAYVDNGITTIIVTGEEPAMIDVGSWINTAIGEAIYRLSKEDSYNGKIDLILPDVTEIFDQEFDGAHALNSITLPKVTTVGDGAFYDCQYLEELTFGSVVTAINHKTRAEFHRVGEKVGGCNLVLNAEQANAATEYQPNVETKTWWNTEWQSITLK